MDDELAGVLEDLTGIDPDLDQALTSITNLVAKAKNRRASHLQTVLYAMSGAQGLDLISVIGLTVRDLTRRSRVIDTLPDPDRKTVLEAGEHAELTSYYYDRRHVTEAIAALDNTEGRWPAMTDEERKELSEKNAKRNEQSGKWPR